ncbi:MAG TPA: hypothetical protein VHG29_11570 [Novosphingobium sp.]|nr:hypothetical protein [Novosphingobium sp.]
MDGDRTTRAWARIDAALARIESAARRPASQTDADSNVAARHAKLKQAVAHSLRQLDELIAGGGA